MEPVRPSPVFSVSCTCRSGIGYLALAGELDMATLPILQAQMADAQEESTGGVVLDIRDVSFLDCAGLRGIFAAWTRAIGEGRSFAVVGATRLVRRVFELTNTAEMLQDAALPLVERLALRPDAPPAGSAAQALADDRHVRDATNETIFREMNEWTRDEVDDRSGASGMQSYLCECGDGRCSEGIRLTCSEYEAVRASPTRFAIALDHENPEVDTVVAENGRFATVEKSFGAPARIARASDPRRWASVPSRNLPRDSPARSRPGRGRSQAPPAP